MTPAPGRHQNEMTPAANRTDCTGGGADEADHHVPGGASQLGRAGPAARGRRRRGHAGAGRLHLLLGHVLHHLLRRHRQSAAPAARLDRVPATPAVSKPVETVDPRTVNAAVFANGFKPVAPWAGSTG